MTNLQAIDLLKGLEQSLDDYCELNDEGKTAFRMAIEALNCSEFPNNSDTISRQAAIDAIKNTYGLSYIEDGFNRQDAVSILENLPSAQTERKTGKWISHYDYCKKHGYIPSGVIALWWCDQCEQGVEHPTNFCPNCGSYNGGEQDESI